MIKHRSLLLLLSILLFALNAKAQIVETVLKSSDFTCIPNASAEEYLSFEIRQPKNFTFLIKTDLCQLLEGKKSETNPKLKQSGYILIDGKRRGLELNEQFIAMIPQKVFYNPVYSQMAVIEFYLYSHIGTPMYRYVILEFRETETITIDEMDYTEPQQIKSIYKVYTSRYRIPPYLVKFPEED
jgi:hypothetical protein